MPGVNLSETTKSLIEQANKSKEKSKTAENLNIAEDTGVSGSLESLATPEDIIDLIAENTMTQAINSNSASQQTSVSPREQTLTSPQGQTLTFPQGQTLTSPQGEVVAPPYLNRQNRVKEAVRSSFNTRVPSLQRNSYISSNYSNQVAQNDSNTGQRIEPIFNLEELDVKPNAYEKLHDNSDATAYQSTIENTYKTVQNISFPKSPAAERAKEDVAPENKTIPETKTQANRDQEATRRLAAQKATDSFAKRTRGGLVESLKTLGTGFNNFVSRHSRTQRENEIHKFFGVEDGNIYAPVSADTHLGLNDAAVPIAALMMEYRNRHSLTRKFINKCAKEAGMTIPQEAMEMGIPNPEAIKFLENLFNGEYTFEAEILKYPANTAGSYHAVNIRVGNYKCVYVHPLAQIAMNADNDSDRVFITFNEYGSKTKKLPRAMEVLFNFNGTINVDKKFFPIPSIVEVSEDSSVFSGIKTYENEIIKALASRGIEAYGRNYSYLISKIAEHFYNTAQNSETDELNQAFGYIRELCRAGIHDTTGNSVTGAIGSELGYLGVYRDEAALMADVVGALYDHFATIKEFQDCVDTENRDLPQLIDEVNLNDPFLVVDRETATIETIPQSSLPANIADFIKGSVGVNQTGGKSNAFYRFLASLFKGTQGDAGLMVEHLEEADNGYFTGTAEELLSFVGRNLLDHNDSGVFKIKSKISREVVRRIGFPRFWNTNNPREGIDFKNEFCATFNEILEMAQSAGVVNLTNGSVRNFPCAVTPIHQREDGEYSWEDYSEALLTVYGNFQVDRLFNVNTMRNAFSNNIGGFEFIHPLPDGIEYMDLYEAVHYCYWNFMDWSEEAEENNIDWKTNDNDLMEDVSKGIYDPQKVYIYTLEAIFNQHHAQQKRLFNSLNKFFYGTLYNYIHYNYDWALDHKPGQQGIINRSREIDSETGEPVYWAMLEGDQVALIDIRTLWKVIQIIDPEIFKYLNLTSPGAALQHPTFQLFFNPDYDPKSVYMTLVVASKVGPILEAELDGDLVRSVKMWDELASTSIVWKCLVDEYQAKAYQNNGERSVLDMLLDPAIPALDKENLCADLTHEADGTNVIVYFSIDYELFNKPQAPYNNNGIPPFANKMSSNLADATQELTNSINKNISLIERQMKQFNNYLEKAQQYSNTDLIMDYAYGVESGLISFIDIPYAQLADAIIYSGYYRTSSSGDKGKTEAALNAYARGIIQQELGYARSDYQMLNNTSFGVVTVQEACSNPGLFLQALFDRNYGFWLADGGHKTKLITWYTLLNEVGETEWNHDSILKFLNAFPELSMVLRTRGVFPTHIIQEARTDRINMRNMCTNNLTGSVSDALRKSKTQKLYTKLNSHVGFLALVSLTVNPIGKTGDQVHDELASSSIDQILNWIQGLAYICQHDHILPSTKAKECFNAIPIEIWDQYSDEFFDLPVLGERQSFSNNPKDIFEERFISDLSNYIDICISNNLFDAQYTDVSPVLYIDEAEAIQIYFSTIESLSHARIPVSISINGQMSRATTPLMFAAMISEDDCGYHEEAIEVPLEDWSSTWENYDRSYIRVSDGLEVNEYTQSSIFYEASASNIPIKIEPKVCCHAQFGICAHHAGQAYSTREDPDAFPSTILGSYLSSIRENSAETGLMKLVSGSLNVDSIAGYSKKDAFPNLDTVSKRRDNLNKAYQANGIEGARIKLGEQLYELYEDTPVDLGTIQLSDCISLAAWMLYETKDKQLVFVSLSELNLIATNVMYFQELRVGLDNLSFNTFKEDFLYALDEYVNNQIEQSEKTDMDLSSILHRCQVMGMNTANYQGVSTPITGSGNRAFALMNYLMTGESPYSQNINNLEKSSDEFSLHPRMTQIQNELLHDSTEASNGEKIIIYDPVIHTTNVQKNDTSQSKFWRTRIYENHSDKKEKTSMEKAVDDFYYDKVLPYASSGQHVTGYIGKGVPTTPDTVNMNVALNPGTGNVWVVDPYIADEYIRLVLYYAEECGVAVHFAWTNSADLERQNQIKAIIEELHLNDSLVERNPKTKYQNTTQVWGSTKTKRYWEINFFERLLANRSATNSPGAFNAGEFTTSDAGKFAIAEVPESLLGSMHLASGDAQILWNKAMTERTKYKQGTIAINRINCFRNSLATWRELQIVSSISIQICSNSDIDFIRNHSEEVKWDDTSDKKQLNADLKRFFAAYDNEASGLPFRTQHVNMKDIVGFAKAIIGSEVTYSPIYFTDPLRRVPYDSKIDNIYPDRDGYFHIDYYQQSGLEDTTVKLLEHGFATNKAEGEIREDAPDPILEDGVTHLAGYMVGSTTQPRRGILGLGQIMESFVEFAVMYKGGYNAADQIDGFLIDPDFADIKNGILQGTTTLEQWTALINSVDHIPFLTDSPLITSTDTNFVRQIKELDACLNDICKRIVHYGLNPATFLASATVDEDGNLRRTGREFPWKFAFSSNSNAFSNNLLFFFHLIRSEFCAANRSDTSEDHLFNKDFQMRVPFYLDNGKVEYKWTNVYFGEHAFSDEHAAFMTYGGETTSSAPSNLWNLGCNNMLNGRGENVDKYMQILWSWHCLQDGGIDSENIGNLVLEFAEEEARENTEENSTNEESKIEE